MVVFDDVLEDPIAYREAVLARPFGTVSLGPDLCFQGIQLAEDQTFPRWIARHFPQLTPTLSFFRQSPIGQAEPNYVHTDRDMGDWTGLLYLNPIPAEGDGTTFWCHRSTGGVASTAQGAAALALEHQAWRNETQWEVIAYVAARFGRALLFPAAWFHSRAIPENYGTGDDARLVQVVFGIGALREGHPHGSDLTRHRVGDRSDLVGGRLRDQGLPPKPGREEGR
jgi:hypothetical protein